MNLTKISRFLALILRHKPEEAGITLDKNGWANVEELIEGVSKKYKGFDYPTLEYIVFTDEKGRYSFNEGNTKIRANQGHSIDVDVQLEEFRPPKFLYHGTCTKSKDSILKEGISSRTRLYVHLSKDIETALEVGSRHGNPVVFEVNSKKMYEDGIKFYRSVNGVWLVKEVDPKYIKLFLYGE